MRPQVLAIDDEPDFLEIEQLFLAKHRIEVTSCDSAPEAVSEVKAGNYDVIVSDYQMPELNGIDLLKILRKDGCDLGFILLTGKGREDVAISALNEGADYYMQKGTDMPTQFELLARHIEDICAARESSRALAESENLLRILNQRLDLLGSITRHDIRGEITIADGYLGLADKETDPALVHAHLIKAKTAIGKVIGIIEDDGVGIAADEKDRIFNFLTPAGVPHGLSIAKRILEAEQIKIEETGVQGKGARFVLHFPAGLYRMKPGIATVNGNYTLRPV